VPRVVLGSIASADLSQPDANEPVSDSALVFDRQSGDIVSSGILAISSADSLPSSFDGILNSPTPTNLRITDIIPFSDSEEIGQNSEPSLGVNPVNPALNRAQMIAGAFVGPGAASYFKSIDGGVTWSDYGSVPSNDKTIAWKQDGSSVLTASMTENTDTTRSSTIRTFSGTAAGSRFGSDAINTFPANGLFDQPWMRTGPSNHVYMAGNDGSKPTGKTASVLVSKDGGSTYDEVLQVTVDRVGGVFDAPSVRLAVNGNTVYSVFTRSTKSLGFDVSGAEYLDAQIGIVRSDNGGADGFTALGSGGNGVTIATPTTYFSSARADTSNAPITLGQERTSSDLAIAVDPRNAQHVVVAYGDAPGTSTIGPGQVQSSGELRLIVSESTDGGETWSQKFSTTTSSFSADRSALPALSILQDGAIGLLYCNYFGSDNSNGILTQYLLTTTDDFATTNLLTLGVETNTTPTIIGQPYIGDFFDLTSIGNTFYGTFCASNQDDGTHAILNPATTFLRNHDGTPGTPDFQLLDAGGNFVATSIDPYVFSCQLVGDFTTNQFAITNEGGNAFITLNPSTPVSAGQDVNGMDGVNVDRQVTQLISMASHVDGNSGLAPMTTPTQTQNDSTLQSTLAPALHS
jgi:hypothetical protein